MPPPSLYLFSFLFFFYLAESRAFPAEYTMATSHTLSTHLPGQKRSKTTKTTPYTINFSSSFVLLFLSFFFHWAVFMEQNRAGLKETKLSDFQSDWHGLELRGDSEHVLSLLIPTLISFLRRCEQTHQVCTLASLSFILFGFHFFQLPP